MQRWRRAALAAVVSAGVAAGICCSGTIVVAVNPLPHGTWGGDHASLVVGDGTSTIQFDCAHGSLDSPIHTDQAGRFDVAGVFVREHGGPVMPGAPEDRHSARFAGTVDNGQLTLLVSVNDLSLHLGPFVLVLGGPPHLTRCL